MKSKKLYSKAPSTQSKLLRNKIIAALPFAIVFAGLVFVYIFTSYYPTVGQNPAAKFIGDQNDSTIGNSVKSELSEIVVSPNPDSSFYDPENKELYLIETKSKSMDVVDTKNNKLVDTINFDYETPPVKDTAVSCI